MTSAYSGNPATGSFEVEPARGVGGVRPYRVSKHRAPIDLNLAGNEGAHLPEELVSNALTPARVRDYPSAAALERAIAAAKGLAPERVIVTAGGDDALARLVRTVLGVGRNAVLPVPSFEMLDRYVKLSGASCAYVPWVTDEFPLAAVEGAISPMTALVFVVSPNNPTGATITEAELEQLLTHHPRVLFAVDLAYAEYADQDLEPVALRFPNAVVVRTFSKAWGMAGMRVGYAAGDEAVISWMRAVGQPYAVSGPSLSAAAAAWASDRAWMAEHIACVRKERERLTELLTDLRQSPRRSQANFVLAEFRDPAWAADGLAGLGIAVRRFPEHPQVSRSLRITCAATTADGDRLEHALRTVLAPEAILFDLDGVLADASQSFRQAICLTAEAFGVHLSTEDVQQAKAAGGANDDWELTHRLVVQRGVKATLEDVTRRFEAYYQGETGKGEGLYRRERLLCSADLVKALAAKWPLAIVTGRPARDAERFLVDHGVRSFFKVLVARESGPMKPDPAPVRAALAGLGVKRGWLIGDTPDDIVAARRADVVPLGVLAPHDPQLMRDALLEAGAARVLGDLNELPGLLHNSCASLT